MNMTTIRPRVSATAPKNVFAAGAISAAYGAAETIRQGAPLNEPQDHPTHDTAKKPISILVVDDHPIVRQGISACLARQANLSIVGEAADGREALRKARDLRPDVVLMDIEMPQMSGLTVTDLLRRELPKVKVLVLSMHSHTEYVLRIIQSGACGYVLKGAPPEELTAAIERVSGGEAFFSPEIARVALNQFVRGNGGNPSAGNLTSREREVLIQIAEGMSNKEIACFLGVGVRTVETHRERIMRKLNIHSIAGLTRFAISQGLVSVQGGLKR